MWAGQGAGGPSAAVLAEQLESIPLGPAGPGAADATDVGLFPRPLIQDGTVGPTEEQLKLPAAPFESGTCDPRIMRPTVAAVPNSMSLKSSWHLPLAIVLQPLQQFGQTTPVVDGTQPNSIMRCSTCRSYMNPFNKWLSGGQSFRCCICGSEQAVGEANYMRLGADGLRQDHYERPELSVGSVEFIAPADYTVRPPMPPCYFFVIDVSQPAVACGGLASICNAISSTLDVLAQRNSATKIGILTYDSSVHFYNLSASLSAAQMMVVADIDDPFPPLPDEHYVTLDGARHILDSLLTAIPAMFANTSNLDSAMASALQAAFRTISHIGGKLMLFTASAPTLGAVRTKSREMPTHYNTEREPALRQAGDAFFRSFASECIQYQICVDVFALSAQYCDLFSLALLPRSTGSALHFYPAFNAVRDGAKLTHELTHSLQRFTGWEAVMRMRCSKGLKVSTFHGHLHVRANDLVVLPSVSEDSTYVAQLALEDTVITDGCVFVQCALLYTSPSSERRIRVHTIRLPVVATAYELFNYVDAVSTATALAKLGVDKALTSRLDETRDVIQQKLVSQLREFKSVHQGHFRKPAHLAYPRSLRHLLPWVHGLLRSNALRGAAEVSPDERCAVMSFLMTASPDLTILAAYPAVFALHVPGWGGEAAEDSFVPPPTAPASIQYLDPQGAYLIDAGYLSFLWVGASVPHRLVQDLFGASMPHSSEGGDLVRLGETSIDNGAPCRLGDLTRSLLASRRQRMVWPLCFTVVQGSPMEGYFAVHFVEDRLPPNCPGYHEFLVHLQKSLSIG
jgi:protein transport protein SEC24